MKTSLTLLLAGSVLAAASPFRRHVFTDYVTDIVYVTVTVDPSSSQFASSSSPSTSTTEETITTTSLFSMTSATQTPIISPTTTPIVVPTTTSTPPADTPLVETITLTEDDSTTTLAPATTSTTAVVKEAAAEVQTSTTAATTTSQTTAAQPSDYASTAVYQHNLHRSNHSAPAMSWNSDLASYAATVAASCVFAHDLTPGSSTGSYGQNIAVYGASGNIESASTSTMIAQAITNMWYNSEVWQFPEADYGEATPDMSNFEAWGHFSQVVWVGSTEVGCASQYCAPGTIYSSMGSWFSVCDYRSQGNMAGDYGTNVLKPLGNPTVTA